MKRIIGVVPYCVQGNNSTFARRRSSFSERRNAQRSWASSFLRKQTVRRIS